MKSITIMLAALGMLAGCATEPVLTEHAKPVPAERIIASELVSAQSEYGSLIIKRDAGAKGGMCTFRLYIDGMPLADIESAEKIQAYLPPGEHIIGARARGLCDGNVETSVTLAPAQTRTYRVGMGAANEILLSPTAF